ncbi:hypothetical protein [Paenibacillus sp. NFR01]|uniref:hypothetical protein n=1 Tax=Paenibacillus sp. NFR01 TaxID=1566279 RepID=UPI0008D6D077|nr:hypothetical protein [Paenibacillus sp. NFR01]SEU14796.1 hypothetical protein SAMN03159358_3617 [Paenibacillus sp. NFR01]
MIMIKAAGRSGEHSLVIRSAPTVSPDHTCRETLRVMFQHPESKCIIVCGEAEEPIGLVMSEAFLLQATEQFSPDPFYNEPIRLLMNRHPLVTDVSTTLGELRQLALSRPDDAQSDCLILTRNGRFAGVVYPSDLGLTPVRL